MLHAKITEVKIGQILIDGLMDENGGYYIAVPQIADLVKTHRNHAGQSFKRLLGKSFKTHKLKTEFNKNATTGISIKLFRQLLSALANKGNQHAQVFLDTLADQSLDQAWSDAFEVERTKEDRQVIWEEAFEANYQDVYDLEQQELFQLEQLEQQLQLHNRSNFRNGKPFYASYATDEDCYQPVAR